jgi:peptidoglycan/xylan/chitin deacetylase (PgdA/CDA1 family)
MREKMRLIVAACFYYSGLLRFAHWWTRRRSGRRLIILKYHRAAGGDLFGQILYLSRHYRILPLETALEQLYSPCSETKQVHERRIPLVLTFDDGYYDNYTHAFAVACQLQVPFTIFLAPGYIDSGARFWWLESDYLLRHAEMDEVVIDGYAYHIKQPEGRKALIQTIDTRLTHAGSIAQREAFLAQLHELLAVPPGNIEEATRPLTWGEIRKMEESGWVSFGAHTMHHPVLARLTDSEEVQWEVEESRKRLEQQFGHHVLTFAYPIGIPGNIGEEGLRAVRAAGFAWAVTSSDGVNTPQTDPHLLKRLSGNLDTHWLVMASEMAGLLRIVSRLKKSYRKIMHLIRKPGA